MNRIRAAALATLMVCAVSLGAAGTASAQDAPPTLTKKVNITGTNKGKDFNGTYTIQRFTTIGNKLYAVGTLKGTLKNRRVNRSNVRIPAAVTRDAATAAQAACDILHLTLGPLDLNLLGLRVQLNQVKLDITAVPGPGNLLGNLLCSITGLLDQNALAGAINNLAAALNAILALVPQSPGTAAAAVTGR